MPLFDTHIVVDWSARSSPSPRRYTKDAIWWAIVRNGALKKVAYERTRHEAITNLASVIETELESTRRVLIGFDFPFGYPDGVAQRLTGHAAALELWAWLDRRIHDSENNSNNRYDVATEINDRYQGIGPCWGRPSTWDYPKVPTRMRDRTCLPEIPQERRIVDKLAGAKTVWQLAYRGCVGSQVLLGLPALERLRHMQPLHGHVAVWPLEGGLTVPDKPVVLVEVYPSLLNEAVSAAACPGEIPDRVQVRVNAKAFASLDALGGLEKLFVGSPALTLSERNLVATEEAWILGVGFEPELRCSANV